LTYRKTGKLAAERVFIVAPKMSAEEVRTGGCGLPRNQPDRPAAARRGLRLASAEARPPPQ
jgi:hypothetical protein